MDLKHEKAYYVVMIVFIACCIVALAANVVVGEKASAAKYAEEVQAIIDSNDDLINSLVSQQSTTLAISAVIVTVLSIYTVFFNDKRDKELKAAKDDYEKQFNRLSNELATDYKAVNESLSQKIEELHMLARSYDVVYTMIWSGNQYWSFQLTKLDELSINDEPSVLMSMMELYERQADLCSIENDKINYNEKIIDVAERLIKSLDENVHIQDRYMVYFRQAKAHMSLGQIYNKFDKDLAIENLNRALEILPMITTVTPFVNNAIGLSYLWLFKATEKKSKNWEYLESAEQYLQMAVKSGIKQHKIVNNLGTVLLNKCINPKYTDRRDEVLRDAEDYFILAYNLEPGYVNISINKADCSLRKLQFMLNVDNISKIVLPSQIEIDMDKDLLDECLEYIHITYDRLDDARHCNPLFINYYHKLMQTRMHHIVFLLKHGEYIGGISEEARDDIRNQVIKVKQLIKKVEYTRELDDENIQFRAMKENFETLSKEIKWAI